MERSLGSKHTDAIVCPIDPLSQAQIPRDKFAVGFAFVDRRRYARLFSLFLSERLANQNGIHRGRTNRKCFSLDVLVILFPDINAVLFCFPSRPK